MAALLNWCWASPPSIVPWDRLHPRGPSGGGDTLWMDVPGDPRQHYIHDLDWPEHSNHLILQQLNRLQNKNIIMRANPATGQTHPVHSEEDAAWIDSQPHLNYIDGGSYFLYLSDQTGWRHLYKISADGKKSSAITEGQFDVTVRVVGGGIQGQAESVRLGIARALVKHNEDFRTTLRKSGFLTRDARKKERKKYGKRGARRSPQWSKR